MKRQLQKTILAVFILSIIAFSIIWVSAHVLLQILWLSSQDVARSIIRLFVIRWLSIPIIAIICMMISMIYSNIVLFKQKKIKSLLLFKDLVVFIVMGFVEYKVQLAQTLIGTIFGGLTGDVDPLMQVDMSFFIFWLPLTQKIMIFAIIHSALMLFFRITYPQKVQIHFLDKMLFIKFLFFTGVGVILYKIHSIYNAVSTYVGYLDIYGYFVPVVISVIVVFVVLTWWILFGVKWSKFTAGTFVGLLVLLGLGNIVWPIYLDKLVYTPNQSAFQERYAGKHAESTRKSFGIDTIDRSDKYVVTKEEIPEILKNNFWQDAPHFLKVVQRNQEVLPIFTIEQVTPLLLSNTQGEFAPYFIASRESVENDKELWDIKHFRNIFGYGAVIGAANKFNKEGYSCLVLKDLELNTNELDIVLKNPQIFFSESYDDYVFINTKMYLPNFTKEGSPLEEQTFNNVRSININFFTKILLAIYHRDMRFILSDYFKPNTQFLYIRKPKEIVKKILPYFHYSEPRLVLHNEELWWELDAYTAVDTVLTSKSVDTPWGKYNWLRSPLKAFVSAYSGEVVFDVMDADNPFIKITSKLYPNLLQNNFQFEKEKYLYPIDLFDIQSKLLQTYHDTNAASFYSRFNQRDLARSKVGNSKDFIKNRMILDKNKIAFQQTYTPKNKNVFAAQLIGYIDDDKKPKLYLYETSASLGIPGLDQAESYLNQDPEFSKMATLWGQIGSKISTSDIVFYPLKDKGLYLGTVFLESEQVNTPLAAQYVVIDGTTISLGSSLNQLFYNASRNLDLQGATPISSQELLRQAIIDAYQDYLRAETARINGNTQEYQENVDKIGASLQQMQTLLQ